MQQKTKRPTRDYTESKEDIAIRTRNILERRAARMKKGDELFKKLLNIDAKVENKTETR